MVYDSINGDHDIYATPWKNGNPYHNPKNETYNTSNSSLSINGSNDTNATEEAKAGAEPTAATPAAAPAELLAKKSTF